MTQPPSGPVDPWSAPHQQPVPPVPPAAPPAMDPWSAYPAPLAMDPWSAYPAAPGWMPPPPAPRGPLNSWAVVSLVTGILALFPIAIAAGITALVQISRRGQRGTGLAIAGLVLSGLWFVFTVFAVIGFFIAGSSQGDLGRVADAGSTTVGTCLSQPSESESIGRPVDCTVEHDAEVFAVEAISGASWPGYDTVDERADGICHGAFASYVGESYDDSGYDYGYFDPDQSEWRGGEHRVVCVVLPGDSDTLTGSARTQG